MIGSAIIRRLEAAGCCNILTPARKELDLMDSIAVSDYFEKTKPEYVFLAAAKVGGIMANSRFPADFIYQNICIQNNVIHTSYRTNVKKMLFLGSSCIYPRDCPQPIKEEYLMTGPLEQTNSAYGVAKISGVQMCWAYNKQYQTKFLPVMPTNLYGMNDNFDLETSHVLPALIRKFHEAKVSGADSVTVWGTGSPMREFLFADDLADACVFVMDMDMTDDEYVNNPLINIGTGKDISIKELALLIKEVVGYSGNIVFDASKPDGTARKLLDVSKLEKSGWTPLKSLQDGLTETYNWYLENTGE